MEIFVQKYSNFQIIFSFQNYQYEYQYSEQNLWIYSNILRTLIVTIDNNIIPWVKNFPLIRNDSIAKRHRQRMSVSLCMFVCHVSQSLSLFVSQIIETVMTSFPLHDNFSTFFWLTWVFPMWYIILVKKDANIPRDLLLLLTKRKKNRCMIDNY